MSIDQSPELSPIIKNYTFEVSSHRQASINHENNRCDDRTLTKQIGQTAIIAVMDGVGSGGPESAIAAEIMKKEIVVNTNLLKDKPTPSRENAESLIENAILNAGTQIRESNFENGKADTTVTIGIITKISDNLHFNVFNVGDSRIYRFTPDNGGTLKQLTTDQSYVQQLLDNGNITPEEAFHNENDNIILNSVRTTNAEKIQKTGWKIQGNEIFIATSDGLTDNFRPEELQQTIVEIYNKNFNPTSKTLKLEEFTKQLVNFAFEKSKQDGQTKDDISAAVLQIKPAS